MDPNQNNQAPQMPQMPVQQPQPNNNFVPAPNMPAKKPANKKMIAIIAGAGGVVLIGVVVLIFVFVLGGSKLSCTQEDEIYGGMQITATTDAYFGGGKLKKLESTGTVQLDSDISSSTADRMVSLLESQFSNGNITRDGNNIIIKETAEVGEDGRLDSDFVVTFGHVGEYSKDDFKQAMERIGYTCK